MVPAGAHDDDVARACLCAQVAWLNAEVIAAEMLALVQVRGDTQACGARWLCCGRPQRSPHQ